MPPHLFGCGSAALWLAFSVSSVVYLFSVSSVFSVVSLLSVSSVSSVVSIPGPQTELGDDKKGRALRSKPGLAKRR